MNTNSTPAMHAADDSQAPKKAANPRANADLLHKAREMDINTDRTRSPQAAAAQAMAGGEEADSDRDVQRSRRAAWRVQRRAADLLMTQFAVRRTPKPDDRILTNATHPFDPEPTDDVWKCYDRLRVFNLPLAEI
jgi:hypothetical protein